MILLERGENDTGREVVLFADRCFAMRRKKLKTALKCYDCASVDEAFKAQGLDDNIRAEELEPEAILRLYNDIIYAKSQRGTL